MEIVIPKSKIKYIKFNRDIVIQFEIGKLIIWANGSNIRGRYEEIKSRFKDSLVEYLEFNLSDDDYEIECKNYD